MKGFLDRPCDIFSEVYFMHTTTKNLKSGQIFLSQNYSVYNIKFFTLTLSSMSVALAVSASVGAGLPMYLPDRLALVK